jgi:hypothetical protein
MPALLRQRNFALLWTGNLISVTGNWMVFVGLPISIFTLTHSVLATSGTFLAALESVLTQSLSAETALLPHLVGEKHLKEVAASLRCQLLGL